MEFEGKVILLTGASSGIGAAAARHLAKLGGKMALVGRNVDRLNKVIEEIVADGSAKPLAIIADITKDAKRIIDETIEHFGKLNVLINNAGMIKNYDFNMDTQIEDFDLTIKINLRSMIILTQLAIPYLEKTKGNIVNTSSTAGRRANNQALPFYISKTGVDQFTKCAAIDLASKGIRVNAVNPGFIRTPMYLQASRPMNEEQYKEFFRARAYRFPLGRVGEVEDVVNAIVYLASDKASFINGTLMTVDGGATVANMN